MKIDNNILNIARQYINHYKRPDYDFLEHRFSSFREVNAKITAQLFDDMKHEPLSSDVYNAYNALSAEVIDQYQHLVNNGYKFRYYAKGDDTKPSLAIKEVLEHKTMAVFPTVDGFGSVDDDYPNNPLLENTDHLIRQGSELKRACVNDLFRIVHDVFGHGMHGLGFSAEHEDYAYQSHRRMFSNTAVAALCTETRGQNSWVNFGKHAEHNKTASPADTIYAPQKIGLLPAASWWY